MIHSSEGTYVALVGGDAYTIRDDAPYITDTVDSSKPSLVDQLEAARLTWRGYFENLPFPVTPARVTRPARPSHRRPGPPSESGPRRPPSE